MERIVPVGCWPCSRGGIKYTLTIPQGAFVPGQMVNYALLIENQSMYDIFGYILQFSQIYRFKYRNAEHGVKNENKIKNILLLKSYEDKCLRLTTRHFESKFLIPPMIPTSLNNIQHIIRVEYLMKITMLVSGCYGNHKFTLPIVIGTIPIVEVSSATNHVITTVGIQCGALSVARVREVSSEEDS